MGDLWNYSTLGNKSKHHHSSVHVSLIHFPYSLPHTEAMNKSSGTISPKMYDNTRGGKFWSLKTILVGEDRPRRYKSLTNLPWGDKLMNTTLHKTCSNIICSSLHSLNETLVWMMPALQSSNLLEHLTDILGVCRGGWTMVAMLFLHRQSRDYTMVLRLSTCQHLRYPYYHCSHRYFEIFNRPLNCYISSEVSNERYYIQHKFIVSRISLLFSVLGKLINFG